MTISRLGEPVFTVNLPDDTWRLTGDSTSIATGPMGETYLINGFANTIYDEPADFDLSAYVASQQEIYNASDGFPERGDDRVVDGVTGATLLESREDRLFFQYGAPNGRALMTIRFEFPEDTPANRAMIEAVMESATWVNG